MEIRLNQLILSLHQNLKLVLIISCSFTFIGIAYSFLTKEVFRAEIKILPESPRDPFSNLALLGQLGGLSNLNPSTSNSVVISSDVYSDIINNKDFLFNISKSNISHFSKNTTVFDYYNFENDFSQFSLEDLLENEIKLNESLNYTIQLEMFFEFLRNRINIEKNDLTRIVKISFKDYDKFIAHQILNLIIDELRSRIILYQSKQISNQLIFLEERTKEARKEFINSQKKLADFTDKNQNIISSTQKSQFEQLQDQKNLSFQIYLSLIQQFEQLKIKALEEVKTFHVIENNSIPNIRIHPKRLLILALSVFIGFIFSIAAASLKANYKELLKLD